MNNKDKIIDWVIQYLPENDKNPNHGYFSAVDVADLIMRFNQKKKKNMGQFKFKIGDKVRLIDDKDIKGVITEYFHYPMYSIDFNGLLDARDESELETYSEEELVEPQVNIFKDAKFGDKYLTKRGDIAIYQYSYLDVDENIFHKMVAEHYTIRCDDEGISEGENRNKDIVSKWQESIDEEKLETESHKIVHSMHSHLKLGETITDYDLKREIYKVGYRKAKEE